LPFPNPKGYKRKMQFHPNDLQELDELTEEHLGFAPLSKGLGLHKALESQGSSPASESPQKPTPLAPAAPNLGTGAVMAGPVSYNTKAAAGSVKQSKSVPHPILGIPAASPPLRSAAFFLDICFVTLPLALGWWVSFGAYSSMMLLESLSTTVGLWALTLWGYLLLSESLGGQTLGKMLLGLRVVEDDKYQKPAGLKDALARHLLLLLGALCFGIGWWAALFDPKKRPLHDRWTSTIVRKVP
jgi:uncharacterized RDD family membrane protein YckC